MIGTTRLCFRSTVLQEPCYHIAVDIPNNKLGEAFDWLKSRVEILQVTETSMFSKFEAWNAESFYFYDNNGNLLEFICRLDVPNTSEQPFDISQLLYISEIGIVCDDVNGMAEKLNASYGLSYYSKQPKLDNFMVLGDEKGLFILVSPDRNWYPTGKKAKIFPLEVVFRGNEGREYILKAGAGLH